MEKKFKKIIEIPCEEDVRMDIVERIRERLSGNKDYVNGDIQIDQDSSPEGVLVIVYEDSEDITETIGWEHDVREE